MTSPSGPPPPYPPPRVWSFPPPPMRKGWFWVALAATILPLVLVIATVVVIVRYEQGDIAAVIDDPEILATIDDECSRMTERVDAVTPAATRAEVADVVTEQNRAVQDMLMALYALGPDKIADDEPMTAWLDDWQDLITARNDYVTELRRSGGSTPDFEIPRDDDDNPITTRMEDAQFDRECRIPAALTNPVPGGSSST